MDTRTTSMIEHGARDWDAAAMLDALPELVNRWRVGDLTIRYCNAAWAAQYGISPADAIDRRVEDFLSEHEMEGLHDQLAQLGPDCPVLADPVARAARHPEGRWIHWVDRYIVGPDGPEVLSVGRDVTDQHIAETRLAESEARFRDLADHSTDIVWHVATTPDPLFDYVSPSVERILGYPPSFFVGDFRRVLDILDDAGRAAIRGASTDGATLDAFDFHLRHADGSVVICETRTTIVDGGVQGLSRDVTELRRLQEGLVVLALRDPLTGLANRRLLDELFDAELARTQRNGAALAVAYIDLDGLKDVNDTHGHDAGDMVIRECARRLLAAVRAADVVARVGGDEFVIVYEPAGTDGAGLIDRVEAHLAEPIRLSPAVSLLCSASIGTADTRVTGYHADRLLATADAAMYQVKRVRRCAAPR
jgi:diguanylate cyclase (GGDEF)-like protein/PAS domain S-box-containing protein